MYTYTIHLSFRLLGAFWNYTQQIYSKIFKTFTTCARRAAAAWWCIANACCGSCLNTHTHTHTHAHTRTHTPIYPHKTHWYSMKYNENGNASWIIRAVGPLFTYIVCACAFVCVCVCVCVRERERVWVSEWLSERVSVYMCVLYVCVCACVCVSVYMYNHK